MRSKGFLARRLLALLPALFVWTALIADDTDIYTGATTGVTAPVDGLIMLMMESRPNTGSSICSNVTNASCATTVGSEIYAKLTDTTNGLGLASGAVYLSDVIRAVYLVILPELVADGRNFHIGIMNNHDNSCSGNTKAGPGKIPSVGANGCSNGGYIIRGFQSIQDPSDTNTNNIPDSVDELMKIIKSFPRGSNGNVAHPYQGKEVYFEYFRYLTGGGVYNGALGYTDFGSANLSPPGDRTPHLNLGEAGNNTAIPTTLPNGSAADDLSPDTSILVDAMGAATTDIKASGVKYVSPFASNPNLYECAKVYAFNNMVGVVNGGSDSDDAIDNTISTGGMGGLTGNFDFKDVIARLYNLDVADGDGADDIAGNGDDIGIDVDGEQNLTSYFIVPNPQNTENGWAAAGGTGAALNASNPQTLLVQLRQAFNDIATRSSTLVAASVPANVFNRTDIVRNVFLAIFEVNDEGYPFWPGNLKKLKIEESADGSTLEIKAANGVNGFSPLDGRISRSAVTFWTDPTELPTAVDERTEDTGKDGRAVTMGGAGQNIPGQDHDGSASPKDQNSDAGARQLYLEPATVTVSAANTTLLALDADATTAGNANMQALVLAPDATLAQKRLQWLRGMDPLDLAGNAGLGLDGNTTVDQTRAYIHLDTNGDNTPDQWRRWMLADALHSLPLTINYGNRPGYDADGDDPDSLDDDNPDIRIFMGTNDGIFHQFKNTTTSATESGEEVWGFAPRQLMDNVAILPQQADVVPPHPYGVDGAPVAFVIDNNGDGTIQHTNGCTTAANDCDKVYIYFGLRRGGKAYYALDASDPDAAPKMLWRIRKSETFSGTTTAATLASTTFTPGVLMEPGLYNEGTLNVGGIDYTIRYNTATQVVLASSVPAKVVGTAFTLTSPGDPDFAELGLTFSTPRTGWIKYRDEPTPVLIFGGGYYGGWLPDHSGRVGKDDLNHTGSDSEGAALFIVHARTGELIWKAVSSGTASNKVHINAGLTDSIASEVAVLDSNANDIIDRVYVGDTGGTVWRFDLPESPAPITGPATLDCPNGTTVTDYRQCWYASKLAILGDTGNNGGTDDRRFFHAPRIVQTIDTNSPNKFDAVLIGSGDRPHPKMDTAAGIDYVDNYFFVIKDRAINSGNPADLDRDGDNDVDADDPLVLGDLFDVTSDSECITQTAACTDLELANGWKLQLEAEGEKNLSSPFIAAGQVFFTTYLPEGEANVGNCGVNIGSSRLYIVSFREGAPLFNLDGDLQANLSKTDRYQQDVEGIAGDVIPLGPKFVMTPGGKVFESGAPGLEPTYWRDKRLDDLSH